MKKGDLVKLNPADPDIGEGNGVWDAGEVFDDFNGKCIFKASIGCSTSHALSDIPGHHHQYPFFPSVVIKK